MAFRVEVEVGVAVVVVVDCSVCKINKSLNCCQRRDIGHGRVPHGGGATPCHSGGVGWGGMAFQDALTAASPRDSVAGMFNGRISFH